MIDQPRIRPEPIRKLADWLTRPSPQLTSDLKRYQARMLTGIALLVLAVSLVFAPVLIIVIPESQSGILIPLYVTAMVLFLLSFFLGRSRHYQLGVLLLIVTQSLLAISATYFFPTIHMLSPAALSFGIFVASVFWQEVRILITAILSITTLTLSVLFFRATIDIQEIVAAHVFVTVMAGANILWRFYRNGLERLRIRELQLQEQRYKDLFETTPVGLARTTVAGSILDANEAFVKLMGYSSASEVTKLNVSDLYKVPAQREELRKMLDEFSMVEHFEMECVRKDKQTIWVDTHIHANRDEAGQIKYYETAAVDITLRKTFEQALRDAEQFTRSIIESVDAGIIVYDRDLRYRIWNPFMEVLTGLPAESVLGRQALLTFPRLARHGVDQILVDALAGKTGLIAEREFVVAETEKRGWVSTTYSPQVSATGEVQGVIAVIHDITERKAMEDALRDSERRLRSYFDGGLVGISINTPTGEWLEVNDKMCKILGYSREELIDHNWREVTHPDDIGIGEAMVRKVINGEITSFDIEKRYVRKDGEIVYATLNLNSTYKDDGTLDYLVVVVQDITRSREAERELRYQAQLLNAVDQAVIATDRDGTITYWNPTAEALYGWSAAEALNRNVQLTTVTDTPQEQASTIINQVLGGQTWSGEFVVRRKDGSTFPAMVRNAPIYDHKGQITGIVGSSVDITERKKAEEEIRYQAQILNTVSQAVIATDLEGKITYWNPKAESMYGWTREEALGRSILGTTVIESAEQQALAVEMMHDFRQGRSWSGEFIVRRKDNSTFMAMVHNAPLYDADSKVVGIIGASFDITERKQAEEAYRALVDHSLQTLIIVQDGKAVFVNNAVEDITGYTPEEYQALSVEELLNVVHPDDREMTLAYNHARLEGKGAPDRYEWRLIRKDGEVRWVEMLAATVEFRGRPATHGALIDITERKLAEERQWTSSRKLAQAHRAAKIASWEWDLATGDLNWSDEMYLLFGVEPDSFTPTTEAYASLVHPDDLEGVMSEEAFQKSIEQDTFELEYRIIDQSTQQIKHVHLWADVDRDADHNPIGMVGILQDITEQFQAEQTLRESEIRFRNMANSAPVLIWMSGVDKLCTYFNEPWLAYTGRTLEQELGNGWAEGVHPEDLERCVQTYESAFDKRERFSTTYRLRRADGSYGWIQDDGAPRFRADGAFLGYIGACIDITDRMEAEEALRRSEARFRNFFDLDLMGASITTLDKKYLAVNQKLCDILGYTRAELMARSWLDVTHPDDQPADIERIEHLRTGEIEQYTATKRYVRKDGEIVHVSIIASPVHDQAGNIDHLVALVEDITPRVKASQALLESTQRLEIMNRIMFKITSNLDIEGIIDAVLLELRQSFPAYRASYMTVLPSGEISVERSFEPEGMPSLQGLSARIATDDPYVQALSTGNAIMAPDVTQDSRYVNLQDAMIAGGTTAVLDVPLKLGGDLLSVLCFDCSEIHHWTDHEAILLNDMSRILEIALQNAREEQRRKLAESAEHEQRMFAEALQAISATLAATLDEEEVLDRVEDGVREVVPHETFAILLVKRNKVFYRRARGFAEMDDPELKGEIGFRLDSTRNLREAYETQAPIIVDDSRSYDGWIDLPITNSIVSCLAAPIHVQDGVIGFITLGHSKPYFFTETHARRLQAFAHQAGLSIHNAQRFETERRERLEAETLRLTAEALATTVTLEDTLGQIMGLLERLVDFRWAMIMLVDDSDLQIESTYGLDGGLSLIGRRYAIADIPLFREALVLGGMQLAADDEIMDQIPWPEGLDHVAGTTISLPLVASDIVIGLLLIGNDRERFDSDDVQAITTFGQQAAIAIRNAHIVQELEVSLTDLQQAQAHLRRVERLNAAGELAAGVAHQINNPLTVVIGQVHVLMQNLSTEHPHYNSLDIVRRAAYRAGNIVQRILNLTRDRAYTTNLIDVNFSINSAVALIRGQLELHTMRLSLHFEDGIPPILGSAEHLEDVWLNLMLNARDAIIQSGTHGTIRIETALDPAGSNIVITLSNDGPPIPEDKLDHIFTPFYTTKEDGTGLGLSVCYDVVTRHDGTISVTSTEKDGTTFTIKLPVASQAEREWMQQRS